MKVYDWGRRPRVRYLAATVAFALFVASGVIAARWRTYPKIKSLAPIPTPLGISGRRLFRFRSGDCLVLQPPVGNISDDDHKSYRGTDETTDLVRLALPASSPWHIDPNRPEEQTTFNCGTFAVGDVIGLTRTDFLDPRAVSITNYQNPAHVLLEQFFERVATFPVGEIDWQELDRLDSLRDDDVVVFATHGSSDAYVHLGKIAKVNGSNRMVSKMGRGPIVRGTIQRTALVYEGRFDEVQIYRRS